MVGPDDRAIYSVQKETEGRFTFIAHESGVYRFCFSNAMSTVTPKTVSFTLVLGEGSRREQVAKSGLLLLPACVQLHAVIGLGPCRSSALIRNYNF